MKNALQNTPEWFLAHRGMISSSRAHCVLYGGPKAWLTLQNLMRLELESEEPLIKELYTDPILRGKEFEGPALAAMELELMMDFERVGFIKHPTIDYIGASSDALADARRINVEAKVYSDQKKHMDVWMTKQMPRDHVGQVQCQMAVHGVELTLFGSYFPEMTHYRQRIAIVEVKRDNAIIDQFYERSERFMRQFRGEEAMIAAPTTVDNIPQFF